VKRRAIKVGPRAGTDIRRMGRYIARFGAPRTAEGYVARLYDFVMRLDIATERGSERSDIHPNLRIVAFEKSAIVALLVSESTAIVVRVFYRGQDWEAALHDQFDTR
jgi:plasmid stabilization system protein ParE